MMIRFSRSIDIKAPPESVFQLVMDLEKRIRLSPNVDVISVRKETAGPVGVGTEFHLHLSSQGQPVEYRCRCTAFEPGRKMETVSLTEQPFGMRVMVEPMPGGTRLTQQEWLGVKYQKPSRPEARSVLGKLANALADGLSGHTVQDKQYHNATLEQELGVQLEQWLQATRAYLENQG